MGDRLFTKEEFLDGLSALCARISSAGLRTAQNPIQLIVTGGAVSVICLHNRISSHDIDYAVQPLDFKLVEALAELGWDVAQQLDWPVSWLSGDVASFFDNDEYTSVLAESVEQDVKLFDGDVLKVYAAKFEWSLTQKLIRVTNERKKPQLDYKDWNDAVALLNILWMRNRRPLTKEDIFTWYPVNASDISVGAVEGLAALYAEKYPKRPAAIVL